MFRPHAVSRLSPHYVWWSHGTQFLNQEGIKFGTLSTFLTEHAATLKAHAQAMAEREGRPYIYLASAGSSKEQRAREIAAADGITEGLVRVFSQLEPCNSLSFRFQQGRPFVNSARRECVHIYYYDMDREFGLIHVMVQTWFRMCMQVFVNGQHWVANKLAPTPSTAFCNQDIRARLAGRSAVRPPSPTACLLAFRTGV